MALVHTIQINGDARMGKVVSATRKSENRRYVACLVVTVTEATVAHFAAEKVKTEAELADYRVKLEERRAAHNGMTVEAAKAWHDKVSDAWYADPLREAAMQRAFARRIYNNAAHDLARTEMIAAGKVAPYVVASPYGIEEAAAQITRLEGILERWPEKVVGNQGVLSWHGTVGNAQKALGAREAGGFTARGYKVEVRTDIAVRETAKRGAKKAVSS
ncbi:MAG: hypothetical protein ACHQQR_04390 [Gemmatimonadales bacterium]